ncbi:MAG: hypothetical protein ACYC0T_14685 [Ramlibacter sp.]
MAALLVAACGGSGEDRFVLPQGGAVLQFQGATEQLRLATLQVDQQIYRDVAFRLAQDGTWQLLSSGEPAALGAAEAPDAVLQASPGTVFGANWRPAVATITVSRLHIGTKVYRNAPLKLAGNRWFWGSALQAGDDAQDLEEVKALTLADFRANPALAATAGHHVVLHSAADRRTQEVPMRLEVGRFRFCMDRQPEGADRIRLLDPNGAAVLTLRAGDACVEQVLAAGRYTMEHEYGGLGAGRTIFVRPSRSAAAAAARPLGATGPTSAGVPEYWAIHVAGTDTHQEGFLSFNDAVPDAQRSCSGFIDAAAQLHDSVRRGPSGEFIGNAILFGTRFVKATLTRSASGSLVSFDSALLNGADFTNAALGEATFLGASVDASAANDCMQVNLAQDYLKFPGFTLHVKGAASFLPSCRRRPVSAPRMAPVSRWCRRTRATCAPTAIPAPACRRRAGSPWPSTRAWQRRCATRSTARTPAGNRPAGDRRGRGGRCATTTT